MTSVLMVASGFSRRRVAGGLRVTRFLAVVRFFAMSWSSLDGVANARHCTSVSHQHAFSTQTSPGGQTTLAEYRQARIASQNLSRFARLMCESAAGQPARPAVGPVVGPSTVWSDRFRNHVAACPDNGRRRGY